MKNLYSKNLILCFSIVVLVFYKSYSQCPNGGATPTGVAFDTTIAIGSGHSTREIKFPKFDPAQGMVTCVKLTMTITGIVNYVAFENNDVSPNSFSATYTRHDTLTGPGLVPSIKMDTVQNYGPYSLSPSDGSPNTGPDYISVGPDTVLHALALSTTVTDSLALTAFYGHDSVSYFYTIDAFTSPGAPGNYSFSVFTSGFVNYKLEYCVCPIAVLPLNVRDLFIKKITTEKAEINWTGYDDPEKNYHYEVELSKDGYHFSSIGTLARITTSNNNNYKFVYSLGNNDKNGVYFFRIKQVYSNGYTRFTEVKSIELKSSGLPRFNFYPNPSNGIVGIKFDNNFNGKLFVQVFNTQGQTIINKEILAVESTYYQVGTLHRGVYWLRMSDVTGRLSSVNQLLIK